MKSRDPVTVRTRILRLLEKIERDTQELSRHVYIGNGGPLSVHGTKKTVARNIEKLRHELEATL